MRCSMKKVGWLVPVVGVAERRRGELAEGIREGEERGS